MFTFALVLCYFNPAKILRLETDISGFIITGVISQKHNNSSEKYP
jgi:hypothetical protein